MNKQVYMLFLVCMAVMLVKSETTIEVDKNGDEYEVKRFNIQGRKLNEGRTQCVVTRRKRDSLPKPMYSNDGSDDEVDDINDGYIIKDEEERQSMLFYSPPLIIPTADEEGGEENGDEINKYKKEGDKISNTDKGNTNENDEMDEYQHNIDNKEEGGDYAIGIIPLDQLPSFDQLQGNGYSVLDIASSSNVNPIVVLHSHVPPKVNYQTHAVFELVPVNHANVKDDKDDDDYYVDKTEPEFDLEEELTPISTTAIWPTVADNSNDIYDDYGLKPIRVQHVAKKPKKPLKGNKKHKMKPSLRPKHKNKYNNSNGAGLTKGDKKRRNNKKRPNSTSVHRPIDNRRRGSHKNNQNNNHDQLNNRKRLAAKSNKNRKNAEVIDQSSNIFNRTQSADDDKNINCIIIRKNPPTTTAPSLWNIFRRSKISSPRSSGYFGKRKRINARFVA